ncbi:trehalase [Spinellus fusiger]|nr:trehalase [Spinellus fusiger]
MKLSLISGLVLAQFAVAYAATEVHQGGKPFTYPRCDSPIYCEGDILKTVELARLFPDSKTFVDMPTSKSVKDVVAAFQKIGGVNATAKDLGVFVNQNFLPAGSDLLKVNITLNEHLPWVKTVKDTKYREWVDYLHTAWSGLTIEFNATSPCEGCTSSKLLTKRPFVVPGGRFREFYYWDSYFVIKGLLLSNLNDLAKGMIENFLDFVNLYGFVPNGARIYYFNRSQPPFLVEMVQAYLEATGDHAFVKSALPTLDKEYNFWISNTTVTIKDHKHRQEHKLNRYYVENHFPRPESYVEDFSTAYNGTNYTPKQVVELFSNLAAGAESGWDYSSRWAKNKVPVAGDTAGHAILRSLNTQNVIPIDLNSLLWSMETNLANWHTKYGGQNGRSDKKARYYKSQATKRLDAMDKLMWNQADAAFYDFNLTSNAQNIEFTPASMYPFWLNAIPKRLQNAKTLTHVFDKVQALLAQFPGVLPTSTYTTTMQWDMPNGWPPLQYITTQAMDNVDGLLKKYKAVNKHIVPLMFSLAERNVASAFCTWYKTGGTLPDLPNKYPGATDDGHMFEKFDANNIGNAGFGGEYTVQIGFGWTNGVTMWLLEKFPNLVAPDCNKVVNYTLPF